jgi:hypothetical protein
LLIDRENWPHHRLWVVFVVVAAVAASGWYIAEGVATGSWPGGSSLPGFVFGVAGGLIILFELLLWFRKKVRVWRIGRAQAWMAAHIWLGLLCLPLLIYHSGFRWGGVLSTVLLVLLLIVVASGVWGLALQQFLPRRMLDELPAETIYSQIGSLSDRLIVEAEQLVRAICGPEAQRNAEAETRPNHDLYVERVVNQVEQQKSGYMVVGAVRSVGLVQGVVLQTRGLPTAVPDAEPLRVFFRKTMVPFLRDGAVGHTPLANQGQAAAVFQDLKTMLPPAAHPSVDVLERMCTQRRQWAQQARMHFWLHNWLLVHLPLSVALVLLMIVHAWVAVKFW